MIPEGFTTKDFPIFPELRISKKLIYSEKVLGLSTRDILWATPSAAGPRPLLIALGLQILGIAASESWLFGTHICYFA